MISFIVPVKNGLAYTRALVESVHARNPGADLEWVIVDSGSTDGTLPYCKQLGAQLVPFDSEPFNYCAAINAGAAVARGDVWIVTNNDVDFRSTGSLATLERVFQEWPVLAVVSPGREHGVAEVEFQLDWVYGPCWAVRPKSFRAWGCMPESVSGYGYDELWTVTRCWHVSRALAYLTGWKVFHHGSVTFAKTGGNTAPAMRRNLTRLLAALQLEELDQGSDVDSVLRNLCRHELERAPSRLAVEPSWANGLRAQGYANAKVATTSESGRRAGVPLVQTHRGVNTSNRQWLPWLANELLLQTHARVVGADGVYATRDSSLAFDPNVAVAIGPPAPPLMPRLPPERSTLRQRLAAFLHHWRHHNTRLPKEW